MSPVWCQPCRAASAVAAGSLALLRHLAGSPDAATDLQDSVQRVLKSLTIPG